MFISMLTVMLIGLNLAGITNWSWNYIIYPVITVIGYFTVCCVLAVWGVVTGKGEN